MTDVAKAVKNGIEELKRFWDENGGRLEHALMPLWDAAEKKAVELWEKYSRNVVKFLRSIGETYETIGQIFDGNMEELEKKFKGLRIVRRAKEIYSNYVAWVKELPMQEYIEEAYQMLKDRYIHN